MGWSLRITLAAATGFILLSPPASANDTKGWYIGLGVGYDHMTPLHLAPPSPTTPIDIGQQDSVLVAGSFGYKWANGIRLEFEAGWDSHSPVSPPGPVDYRGHTSLDSQLVNVLYDWGLPWPFATLSTGFGMGAGTFNTVINQTPFLPGISLLNGGHTEFMWQGIVGLNFDLSTDTELFLDYRYRSAEIGGTIPTDFPSFAPLHVSQAQEHVAMIGVRWYVGQPPPPPP